MQGAPRALFENPCEFRCDFISARSNFSGRVESLLDLGGVMAKIEFTLRPLADAAPRRQPRYPAKAGRSPDHYGCQKMNREYFSARNAPPVTTWTTTT